MVSLSLKARGGLQLIFALKSRAFKAGGAAVPLALPLYPDLVWLGLGLDIPFLRLLSRCLKLFFVWIIYIHSGTLPCGHPWNVITYNNADTLLGLECHLHRPTYKQTPEMRTPFHSVKQTFYITPTISPPIQTHRYSGRQLGTTFVVSFAKQTARWTGG